MGICECHRFALVLYVKIELPYDVGVKLKTSRCSAKKNDKTPQNRKIDIHRRAFGGYSYVSGARIIKIFKHIISEI